MNGGIREYARYRGVSHTAVQKAIASQRIQLTADGAINFELADSQWKRNGVPVAHKAQPVKAKPKAQQAPQPKAAKAEADDRSESFMAAKTRRERAEADLAELKARRAAGDVIETVDARKAFRSVGRIYTAARESLPKQLAPKLIGLTDLIVIEALLREELRAADTRIADEIESRHGELLNEKEAGDGDSLGGL